MGCSPHGEDVQRQWPESLLDVLYVQEIVAGVGPLTCTRLGVCFPNVKYVKEPCCRAMLIGLKTLFQRFSLTGGTGQSLPLCTLSTQAFCFYYKMFAY